jgi:hypothetical protein
MRPGSPPPEETIDVLTAEAIVTEALQIGDEQAAKQAAGREMADAMRYNCTLHLQRALRETQARLDRAEQRAAGWREGGSREAAEQRAEDWQAAWQAAKRQEEDAAASSKAAEGCARVWEKRAEFSATLLRAAEDRTDRAQAGMQGAEKDATAEQAARRVVEQLLAAEAAWALRVFVVMIALICTKSFQPLTLYFVQRFVQIL